MGWTAAGDTVVGHHSICSAGGPREQIMLTQEQVAVDHGVTKFPQSWALGLQLRYGDVAWGRVFLAECPCMGLQCCRQCFCSFRLNPAVFIQAAPALSRSPAPPADGRARQWHRHRVYSVFLQSLTQWSPGYRSINHYESVLRLLVSH